MNDSPENRLFLGEDSFERVGSRAQKKNPNRFAIVLKKTLNRFIIIRMNRCQSLPKERTQFCFIKEGKNANECILNLI